MAQKNQNDEFYANNKRVLEFTILSTDEDPAVPLDLTNLLIRWALSKQLSAGYSTTPVLIKDNDSVGGIEVVDGPGGICQVSIEPEDTLTLSGSFYQELEIVDSASDPVVVATGTILIKKNVRNTL